MERTTRYSKKREAILAAIRSTDCHPSAEWIYQALKPQYPDLSLGTIYRNLLYFQEQGTVRSVGAVQGQERYDAVTEPHPHFVCRRCGLVADLHQVDLGAELDQIVGEQYGFTVEYRELTYHGLCRTCTWQSTQHLEEETVP